MTSTIAHIVGARPNYMKAAPVIEALSRRGAEQILIHTGQHYDRELSQVFFDELELPRPDINLGVGSGSHANQTAALLTGLEATFIENRPTTVVVYGDVNSTLAGALVAAKLGISIAHVEAGLRSFDRSMPEEINRVVTDVLATSHFVTSPEGMEHLEREGISAEQMHLVGNPMIDTLLRFRDLVDAGPILADLGVAGDYGIVTLHRPSNVDDVDVAKGLVSALEEVSRDIPLIFPVHPRGRDSLAAAGLESTDSLRVTAPLPYTSFLALMKQARIVLTDSGGIQEETTVLGVPCLTVRWNTERPITVTHGTNTIVGTDPARIVVAAREGLARTTRAGPLPPLWDGRAGDRIAALLLDGLTAA